MPNQTWSQMKAAVAAQMHSDPQRATLSTRAWQAVEEGLQHLTGVGYGFEIAPRGTLQELEDSKEAGNQTRPLSIADAQGLVAQPPNVLRDSFDAIVRNKTN